MSDDDLTIAYQLGVEDMRSKLHKQADEIERFKADIERQEMIIDELKHENEKLRQSYIPFAEKHNELRAAVKQLFEDRTSKTFTQHLSWLQRYIEQ